MPYSGVVLGRREFGKAAPHERMALQVRSDGKTARGPLSRLASESTVPLADERLHGFPGIAGRRIRVLRNRRPAGGEQTERQDDALVRHDPIMGNSLTHGKPYEQPPAKRRTRIPIPIRLARQ